MWLREGGAKYMLFIMLLFYYFSMIIDVLHSKTSNKHWVHSLCLLFVPVGSRMAWKPDYKSIFTKVPNASSGSTARLCKLCSKIVYNMKNHYLYHNPGNFLCPVCLHTFSRPDNLKQHMKHKHYYYQNTVTDIHYTSTM